MNGLYLTGQKKVTLGEVCFTPDQQQKMDQFLKEYRHREVLSRYRLPVNNKLLMYGKSGCGKTMTAKAIAQELGRRIYIVNLGQIISSKLGETAKNISMLFTTVAHNQAILFFDEFDSLGKIRDYDNRDSGEMKRVVNTLLQLIDDLPNDAVLIAATNQLHMIDEALLRRFELRMEFELPGHQALDHYYDIMLERYPAQYRRIERKYGISYAEARDVLFYQVKMRIIEHEEQAELRPV